MCSRLPSALQVFISGFRSFKSQVELEPFDPKHNVVVGRNGSGKTSFFDAIQFALLAPRFVNLRQEERAGLLHEGAGKAVMTAYVEVVFDNSDGRMAQDGDEVVVRRTIGLKKDEFFVNRKRVTKGEVSSLLESAGLSKSNPYYIVEQGKVRSLTIMQDSERLDLLKEVAGTSVYEERREESLKIMQDTQMRREKIQEVLSYIDTRLCSLEEEKAELGVYQQLDRDRRALQYTLYDAELCEAREQLSALEASREEDMNRTEELHEELRQVRHKVIEKETRLSEATGQCNRLKEKKEALEEEQRRIISRQATLELEVKDVKERVEGDRENQEALAAEAKKLDCFIADREKELEEKIEPAFLVAQEAFSVAERSLMEVTAQRDGLYEKQGRKGQYTTKKQRDQALKTQISGLHERALGLISQAEVAERPIKELREQEALHNSTAKELEASIRSNQVEIGDMSTEISKRIQTRNSLAEDRKHLWRKQEQLADQVAELKAEVDSVERKLRSGTPQAVSRGLEAVSQHARQQGMTGYIGSLIEIFQLSDPKFAAAVEAAAGNSLFHVVVDTDATAAVLMSFLGKHQLGRLTFMPLNRLRFRGPEKYPDSEHAVALMQVALRYPPHLEPAIQQVFGHTLIARSLDVAGQFAVQYGMDCVTMEGDEFSRKGAVQGGYKDDKSNRLMCMANFCKARESLKDVTEQHRVTESKAKEVDHEVTVVMAELQRLEAKRATLRRTIEEQGRQLELEQQAAVAVGEKADTEAERVPILRSEAASMNAKADLLQKELGTPLSSGLSDADAALLANLNRDRIPQITADLGKKGSVLESITDEKQKLVALLRDNLRIRRREVASLLEVNRGGVGSSNRAAEIQRRQESLEAYQAELTAAKKALGEGRDQLGELESKINTLLQESRSLENDLEQLRGREGGDGNALAEATKMHERLLNKREVLYQRREDSMRKIQELGSLPTAELEHFTSLRGKALMKKLHETSEKLKGYSHVNKKALEQYVNFSEQRAELLDRKSELDAGAQSISELVLALDRQKDEAIMRTFRGVSLNFEQVFKELVPKGVGKLIMRRSAPESEDGDKEAGTGGTAAAPPHVSDELSVSSLRGVRVLVSFTPGGRTYDMIELSGGQQTLVALSLLFSIQRCDPAPFYIFDEIDANLDSSYRTAVAALLQKQAHNEEAPAQFITSTFSQEFVRVASSVYGISLQNKMSNMHLLSSGEALAFVADLQEGMNEGNESITENAMHVSGDEDEEEENDKQLTPVGKRRHG